MWLRNNKKLNLLKLNYNKKYFSLFNSKDNITLYQYKICPFCNRVKAFLDYNKLNYNSIEVNPTTKKEIKFSGSSKVPVATVNDKTLVGSMYIIENIRDTLLQNRIEVQALWTDDTEKWAKWSEFKLAVLLYPNITRTFGESWKAFEYCKDVTTWSFKDRLINRYIGPIAMYFANSKIKKKYSIVNERSELDALLKEWTDALGSNTFLHGDKITLPDLLIYGVLRGLEGLPTFTYVMNQHPTLEKWYNSVKKSIGNQ